MRSEPAAMAQLRAWFAAEGMTPLRFQEDAWAACFAGESGLIHLPTGAGKTYAAYLAGLAETLEDPGGLRVLFITPLRAVARDIELALRRPVEALGAQLRVESRTGDTKSSLRARQRRRLPEVLVTTPESLSLLLTRDDAREQLGGLRLAILDEWHELLGGKRGTQLELAMARLRRFAPKLRSWALTATLANVEEAARAAVGMRAPEPTIVTGDIPRPVEIELLLAGEADALPWNGHLGMRALPAVLEALERSESTLLFTNTRGQAERWFEELVSARPEWRDRAALHHGSLDRAEREAAERGLDDGSLRFVVATSSLDLGVDFSPVEQVIQIGSVKGVARLMQRAGRSGHRPGRPCRILCAPTHALEIVELCAARPPFRPDASKRGAPRSPPRRARPAPRDLRPRRRLRGRRDLRRAARRGRLRRAQPRRARRHAGPRLPRLGESTGLPRLPPRRHRGRTLHGHRAPHRAAAPHEPWAPSPPTPPWKCASCAASASAASRSPSSRGCDLASASASRAGCWSCAGCGR